MQNAWNVIRATLGKFAFYEIKDIVALAGFNISSVSHIQQGGYPGGGRGNLMAAIDAGWNAFERPDQERFVSIVVEEILKKIPI